MTEKNTILQQTIVDELGLGDLPEERKAQILVDLLELVLKRLYMETMDRLTKEEQQELMNMLEEKADQENVEAFLRGKVSDYDEFVKKVVSELKDELKEDIASFGEDAPLEGK
jgi:vacuolar-type H+-ATPase subunit C/Vma6